MRLFVASALATIAVMALLWRTKAEPIISADIAPAPPRFDWKPVTSLDFAIGPGEVRRFPVTTARRMRLSVDADASVSFLISADGTRLCDAEKVFSASPECESIGGSSATLIVGDSRTITVGDVIGSAAALYGKDAHPIKQMVLPARVSAVLYEWSCIANCPK